MTNETNMSNNYYMNGNMLSVQYFTNDTQLQDNGYYAVIECKRKTIKESLCKNCNFRVRFHKLLALIHYSNVYRSYGLQELDNHFGILSHFCMYINEVFSKNKEFVQNSTCLSLSIDNLQRPVIRIHPSDYSSRCSFHRTVQKNTRMQHNSPDTLGWHQETGCMS